MRSPSPYPDCPFDGEEAGFSGGGEVDAPEFSVAGRWGKMISRISHEKLQDIKNRLKNSRCAVCESGKLEIEIPQDQIRSIFPPYGGGTFRGLNIICNGCQNSSYYDLERGCFGEAVTSSF